MQALEFARGKPERRRLDAAHGFAFAAGVFERCTGFLQQSRVIETGTRHQGGDTELQRRGSIGCRTFDLLRGTDYR